ncbi:MAG: dTDP-4-dehydrorhamnose reductase [Bacteroidales bacterium]|nr:dTDP-4-dehydrorhamnose reductase [Bacteroidales bacterium]
MRNTLITGASGQLGRELKRITALRRTFFYTDLHSCEEEGIVSLDICNKDAVREFVQKNNIGTIINCAAYTDVEGAESNQELCYRINRDGALSLALAAAEVDAVMVHISTDYVFDGHFRRGGYKESDTASPLSVYGRSKLMSELALKATGVRGVILRTSWLYSPYGKNFVKTMLAKGKTSDHINVIMDQIGSPTYAADLARAILQIVPKIGDRRAEIYHYSNLGECSWQNFASYIMIYGGLHCKVNGITSTEYPQKAQRPAYSYMDKSKTIADFGITIPDWKSSLKKCIRRMK